MSNEINRETDNFGIRLKKTRLKKGLTGKQFAEIIGISQGSLSELENGKRDPSGKIFQGILENTDIDISWLITGKKEEKQKDKERIGSKFEILNQVEEWLCEEIEKNPRRESWFELQMIDCFESFKKWKEEKEESETREASTSTRKVA